MQDREYRWQDHVPPSVGIAPGLVFAVAFLVAVIAIGGYAHAERDAEQRERIVQSIEDSAPMNHAAAGTTLFSRASAPVSAESPVLLLACDWAAPKS